MNDACELEGHDSAPDVSIGGFDNDVNDFFGRYYSRLRG